MIEEGVADENHHLNQARRAEKPDGNTEDDMEVDLAMNKNPEMADETGEKLKERCGGGLNHIWGHGKDFMEKQLPTCRSVIQKAMLERERTVLENNLHFSQVSLPDCAKVVSQSLVSHWKDVNPLLTHPVLLEEKSVLSKVTRLLERTRDVVNHKASKKARESFFMILDKLFDILSCQHKIRLCADKDSGEYNGKHIKYLV